MRKNLNAQKAAFGLLFLYYPSVSYAEKHYLCTHNLKTMGSIFVIQGVMIYIYGFDHNPPHIHVKSGSDEFTITIKDRVIEGKARSKTVGIVNEFIDEHEEEIMALWEKAQRGETIKKIR